MQGWGHAEKVDHRALFDRPARRGVRLVAWRLSGQDDEGDDHVDRTPFDVDLPGANLDLDGHPTVVGGVPCAWQCRPGEPRCRRQGVRR